MKASSSETGLHMELSLSEKFQRKFLKTPVSKGLSGNVISFYSKLIPSPDLLSLFFLFYLNAQCHCKKLQTMEDTQYLYNNNHLDLIQEEVLEEELCHEDDDYILKDQVYVHFYLPSYLCSLLLSSYPSRSSFVLK